jgi:MtN3 and saliva related transmembrane protein
MSIEQTSTYANIVGLVAGALTTLSFVPQLLQTLRTRRAGDVAYGMLMFFITGVTLWLIYGLMLRSLPIILANTATLVLTLTILALKFRYRRTDGE